jgi:hypothetical protein
MTQIMFPLDKAHEALDEFLGEPVERWIAGEDGEPVAWITPAGLHDKTVNGYRQWLESQEVRGEEDGLEPGYRPFLHSPMAMGGERLLPIEPFEEPLARCAFGKPYADLDETQKIRVDGAAIMCVLRTTLDPDGQGAVPILMIGHEPDEPGPALRWQIAYATPVHGLYLRTTPAMFGDEWAIVTGSGYRLASGWLSRDDATATAEALGRTLPGLDWMRITPKGFTPKAQKAIRAVLKRYGYFGLNKDEPEPEVMADEVPPQEAPAETAAAR